MKLYEAFRGGYGDWTTMALDTDITNYVIRVWFDPKSTTEIAPLDLYFKIIGYTELPNDILLHLVSVEDEPAEDSANRHGVTFQLLSNLCGRHGFEILVSDQEFDEDEPED